VTTVSSGQTSAISAGQSINGGLVLGLLRVIFARRDAPLPTAGLPSTAERLGHLDESGSLSLDSFRAGGVSSIENEGHKRTHVAWAMCKPLAEPIAANTFPRLASALDYPRPVRPHDINHFTQRSTGSLLRKAITSGSIVSGAEAPNIATATMTSHRSLKAMDNSRTWVASETS